MTSDGTPKQNAERPARTNMFVMAVLSAGTGSAPVKVRNLSFQGALIEGANLPPASQDVLLRRGKLSATGKLVWVSDGRAGVRFDEPIVVAHWLPGGKASRREELIDAVFYGAGSQKAGADGDALGMTRGTNQKGEIIGMVVKLEELAAELSDDPDLVARYAGCIQTLDLAAQLLKNLADEKE